MSQSNPFPFFYRWTDPGLSSVIKICSPCSSVIQGASQMGPPLPPFPAPSTPYLSSFSHLQTSQPLLTLFFCHKCPSMPFLLFSVGVNFFSLFLKDQFAYHHLRGIFQDFLHPRGSKVE